MQKEVPKYTPDPKRNFTRNRKLHYDPTAATASAFVQQRGKLFPSVFEEILHRFTFQNRPKRQWDEYTLLEA